MVSGISGNTSAVAWQDRIQQRKEDLNQLETALENGDIGTAQNAFNDLQSLHPGNEQQSDATNTSGSNGTKASNPIASDFSALGQALQAGNVADAQQAFSQLQSDMQAHKGVGHHHHHHGKGMAPPQGIGTASSTDAASNNPIANDFSALGQALQTGNLSDAQEAFSQLQSDIQNRNSAANQAKTSSNPLTQALAAYQQNSAQDPMAALMSALQSGIGANTMV